MDIVKKLPDSLKRHVFEYNPDHRKFLKDVHIELLDRIHTCNSWRCRARIDMRRNAYYQTKLTGDRHMSIFCSWTCLYDEQTYRDNREFFDIANTADAYMALMTP